MKPLKDDGCSKNLLAEYVNTLESLDIGVFTLDSKGYIIEQNSVSKKWFGEFENSPYDDFCRVKLSDLCLKESKNIRAKNRKKYQVNSMNFSFIEGNYTIVLFKEIVEYFDFINSKLSEDGYSSKNSYVLDRTSFIKNMKYIIYEADIIRSKVSLLFIEVANLHSIVDTYGKKNGDVIMDIIARRLKNILRESDLIGKFDNNRFAVAIGGIDGIDIPKKISKKILYNISRPIIIDDGHKISIDILVGISIYPDDSTDIDELVSQADLARYRMKIKTRKWLMSFIA